jgi:hypothetical protein
MAILRYLYIAIPTIGRFSCFPWDDRSFRDRLAGWNRFGLLGQRSAATRMNGGFENTQRDDLWSIPLGSWIQCCRKTLPTATDGKYHHPQVGSSLNLLYRFTTCSIILGSKTLTKTVAS